MLNLVVNLLELPCLHVDLKKNDQKHPPPPPPSKIISSVSEGTRACHRIAQYSELWKQPMNVGKTVAQIFYSQIKEPVVHILMLGQKLKIAKSCLKANSENASSPIRFPIFLGFSPSFSKLNKKHLGGSLK